MNEQNSGSLDRSQNRKANRNFADKIQYLLNEEKQLLQSIATRAPLPGILNGICSALDCQIGNVVSYISVPGDFAGEPAVMAMNAARFGLHTFCSGSVADENDEPLGSLEMYCCVPRLPSPREFELIERAKCLARIAIKLHNGAEHHGKCGIRGNRTVRGRVLEWPASMN
jgi:hypothetical protein